MLSHLKRLGKESLVYGLGSAAMRLAAIVTLPIYARVFSPAEVGVLELATVTYMLLALTLDLGLSSGFMRSYFDHDEADRERKVIVSTALEVMFGGCVLMALILISFSSSVAALIFGDSGRGDL